MATYKEIRGTNIEVLSSDPSNPVEGQVWFNSTSNVLKGQAATTAGSWATGGALNSARSNSGGAGTQTSALSFGGTPNPLQATTESYNGTSWTELNDLNLGRNNLAGAGASNTSALAVGGDVPSGPTIGTAVTESWNGTNWTEVNDLNAGRGRFTSAGTATAALVTGGTPPNEGTDATELWNGTNWTEVNDLGTARTYVVLSGISTSAIVGGGLSPPGSQKLESESWNGTNWTEVSDLNTGKGSGGAFGEDNSNAVSVAGATAELWNGSNWTETTDLSVPRYTTAAGQTPSAAGIMFAGSAPGGVSNATELFTGAGPVTRTFTDS